MIPCLDLWLLQQATLLLLYTFSFHIIVIKYDITELQRLEGTSGAGSSAEQLQEEKMDGRDSQTPIFWWGLRYLKAEQKQ